MVYNKDVRPESADHTYRNQIAEYVAARADKEFVRFGLNSFKETLFHDVHTYTQEQFEEYLNRIVQ